MTQGSGSPFVGRDPLSTARTAPSSAEAFDFVQRQFALRLAMLSWRPACTPSCSISPALGGVPWQPCCPSVQILVTTLTRGQSRGADLDIGPPEHGSGVLPPFPAAAARRPPHGPAGRSRKTPTPARRAYAQPRTCGCSAAHVGDDREGRTDTPGSNGSIR